MCVPYTGSEAWTRSMGYDIVDEWRPWTSNGQVAGYFICSSSSFGKDKPFLAFEFQLMRLIFQ
jgi:hypothetical protein